MKQTYIVINKRCRAVAQVLRGFIASACGAARQASLPSISSALSTPSLRRHVSPDPSSNLPMLLLIYHHLYYMICGVSIIGIYRWQAGSQGVRSRLVHAHTQLPPCHRLTGN